MLISEFFKNRILEASISVGSIVFLSIYTFNFFTKTKKKVIRIIDTMDALKKKTVMMKDRDHVENIVSQLIKGGASKLQVISDFDHTISRVHLNGAECATTYGILKHGQFTEESFRDQSSLLYKHYHPIETDPNLTKAQKTPYMIEWYTKSRNLIPQSGIKKQSIKEMVMLSNVCLRNGCDTVFESLYKHDVPLLVFSAGIGDVLKEVLQQQHILFPNIKIIANFLKFDDKDNLLGFKGNLIHTFNKNQGSIENSDYFHHLKTRNNIILLGDSLGDIDMSEGVEDVNCILKIGFLNCKIEENLPEFLNAFDIVLTDDQTMDVLVGLLQSIL